jgi:hypothetical protein
MHPGWQCYASKQCVDIEVSHNKLQVDPDSASTVGLFRKLAGEYAPEGESFIVTPLWPTAYPLLDRKSPVWEIYALFPRTPVFELKEVERIKEAKPRFVFVLDVPLDGREELRFKNTHPIIYQYILDNFELLPDSPSSAYKIYKAKGGV